MDLYCQKCSENWDFWAVMQDDGDDLEPVPKTETRSAKQRFLDGDGCPSCEWGKTSPKRQDLRALAMSVCVDMLGDDVDGMASMLDDFEYAGMLDE